MSAAAGSVADRAYGALLGLAVGDALGMPTQNLSRQVIAARWGVLDRFVAAPEDNPVSHGMAAGQVTDDTDQAVILGRLLVAGGGVVDPYAFGVELVVWQEEMTRQGSSDLLGPSTLRAVRALQDGVPVDQTGRYGDTNGAAMRVAPVGIATPYEPLGSLVDAVEDAGRVTHNTGLAMAGAAAIAAAVSAGVSGEPMPVVLEAAESAARLGAERGAYAAGADVAARIAWAVALARAARGPAEVLDVIDRLVGTSLATQESVPAAIAVLAAFPDDPWAVCRYAASVGGDCDTIGAMAGAVAGAVHGASAFPPSVVVALTRANPHLDLEPLSFDLLQLRGRT